MYVKHVLDNYNRESYINLPADTQIRGRWKNSWFNPISKIWSDDHFVYIYVYVCMYSLNTCILIFGQEILNLFYSLCIDHLWLLRIMEQKCGEQSGIFMRYGKDLRKPRKIFLYLINWQWPRITGRQKQTIFPICYYVTLNWNTGPLNINIITIVS